jgi:hypothetical protein
MKKFIVENGIRKINPAWKEQQLQQQQLQSTGGNIVLPTYTNRATALAVVDAAPEKEEEITVTPLHTAAVAQYKAQVEPEIFVQVTHTEDGESASSGNGGIEQLYQRMAKYEIPVGMLSKLLEVRQFDLIEIIVDDSYSMTLLTDAKGPRGDFMNRWWEAKYRISQMIELLAFVISPPISVRFLNRPTVLLLQREAHETPQAYIDRSETLLINEFYKDPSGTTPALEAISRSLKSRPDQAVLRYFMGDGVPNGGQVECRKIEALLMHRNSPEKNPFTFMSCTGNDRDVEWMKQCEEVAPYCAEFDDYGDESREILKDQGEAFPYSYGLHLVAQIVAAFNPHDLDAMDESVPFTKQTLDNLLGYQTSPEEYKYYFDKFVVSQHKLPQESYQRRNFVARLPSLYKQFESAASALDIPAAVQYKASLKQTQFQSQSEQQHVRTAAVSQPQGDACCLIL